MKGLQNYYEIAFKSEYEERPSPEDQKYWIVFKMYTAFVLRKKITIFTVEKQI